MIIRDFYHDEIELTNERWAYVVGKHPEVRSHHSKIALVLKEPDVVKSSKRDKNILLYYKFFPEILKGKYLLIVVAKGLRNFIVTVYVTDKIKGGEVVWRKS